MGQTDHRKLKLNSQSLSLVRKQVLTVGQISKMLSVSPRTATKYIDTGTIKGFRIPHSGITDKDGDRRAYLEDVQDLQRKCGMYVDPILDPSGDVISFGVNVVIPDTKPIDNLLELGILLGNVRQLARTIVLGTGYGISQMLNVYNRVKELHPKMITIILFDESEQNLYNHYLIGDMRSMFPHNLTKINEFARDFIRPDYEAIERELGYRTKRNEKQKAQHEQRQTDSSELG